jgi:hypothetical protein
VNWPVIAHDMFELFVVLVALGLTWLAAMLVLIVALSPILYLVARRGVTRRWP